MTNADKRSPTEVWEPAGRFRIKVNNGAQYIAVESPRVFTKRDEELRDRILADHASATLLEDACNVMKEFLPSYLGAQSRHHEQYHDGQFSLASCPEPRCVKVREWGVRYDDLITRYASQKEGRNG